MNKIRKRHIAYSEKVRSRKFELMKKAQKIYLNDKSAYNCNKLKHHGFRIIRKSNSVGRVSP